MSITIGDVSQSDLECIVEMNNAAVPHVNSLTFEDIEKFKNEAPYFRTAHKDGQLAGFLIALAPDVSYESLNFKWFCQKYKQFIYIDRVVVFKEFRGHGVGKVFYADVQSFAEVSAPYLACEVNLDPPNEVSLLFHGTIGFQEVGQLKHEDGKHVSLLVKELPCYEFARSQLQRAST